MENPEVKSTVLDDFMSVIFNINHRMGQRQDPGVVREFSSQEMVRKAHSAKRRASCEVLPACSKQVTLCQ